MNWISFRYWASSPLGDDFNSPKETGAVYQICILPAKWVDMDDVKSINVNYEQ